MDMSMVGNRVERIFILRPWKLLFWEHVYEHEKRWKVTYICAPHLWLGIFCSNHGFWKQHFLAIQGNHFCFSFVFLFGLWTICFYVDFAYTFSFRLILFPVPWSHLSPSPSPLKHLFPQCLHSSAPISCVLLPPLPSCSPSTVPFQVPQLQWVLQTELKSWSWSSI